MKLKQLNPLILASVATYSKRIALTAAAMVSLSGLSQAAVTVIDEGLNNTGNNTNIDDTVFTGKAMNFVMGAGSDYTLTTVVLGFGSIDNNETPLVQIWSDEGGTTPLASLLETLSNPATLVNGANTFTSAGLNLQAGQTYWVAVNSTSNPFVWLGGTDTTVTSDIGATHTSRIFATGSQGLNPATWSGAGSGVFNQIQVNAIPEPSTALLGGLGMLALLRRRR